VAASCVSLRSVFLLFIAEWCFRFQWPVLLTAVCDDPIPALNGVVTLTHGHVWSVPGERTTSFAPKVPQEHGDYTNLYHSRTLVPAVLTATSQSSGNGHKLITAEVCISTTVSVGLTGAGRGNEWRISRLSLASLQNTVILPPPHAGNL